MNPRDLLDRLEIERLTTTEVIVATMRHCGKTFEEIGQELGFTRQAAEYHYKNAKRKTGGGDLDA